MNINLTPALEQFVRDQANSGDYNNASEVVREAIRLLKREEEERALKLKHLRDAIHTGDKALEQGDYTALNNDTELDAVFVSL